MAVNPSIRVPALKFVQINLHRSPLAASLLSAMAVKDKVDVVLIQEPPVKRNQVYGLSELSPSGVICGSGVGVQPTSAIAFYGNKPVVPFFVSELSNDKHCVVRLSVTGCASITIVSVYHTPTRHDNTADLAELSDILAALGGELVLVGGDFNARSRHWGDVEDSVRGQRVEGFCAAHNLYLANDANCGPTFARSSGACSFIDLTFCSLNLSALVSNWTVGGVLSGSDHRPVSFDIGDVSDLVDSTSVSKRFDLRRANWERFDECFGARMSDFETSCGACDSKDAVQEVATSLMAAISSAAEVAIPKRRPFKRSTVWWCPELSSLRRQVRKCRDAMRRHKGGDASGLRCAYVATFNRYKTLISKRKAESFREFCEKSSSADPFGSVYKLYGPKALKSVPLRQIEKPDGTFTANERETCDHLLECYFEDPEDQELVEEAVREGSDMVSEDDHLFTQWELDAVVRKLGNKKAPGPDNISVPILKRAYYFNRTWFLMFFNLCLSFGCFPSEFKKGSVVLLPKPTNGRAVKTFKMFRPICLFPYLGKVLDKMFINRVNWFLWSRRLMSPRQSGFQPQRSASDTVYELVEAIREGMVGPSRRKRRRVLAVSVDVEKAFDSVRWPDLIRIVAGLGCPRNLFRLLCDYLRDREVGIELKSGVFSRRQKQGCAQGTPSGPFLWNVFYNDLLSLEFEEGVQLFGYADDLLILVSDRESLPLSHLRAKTERALNLINDWAVQRSITFNALKSCAVLFTKTRNRVVFSPGPRLAGVEIKVEESFKYLGVVIDWRLNFTEHIDSVCGKAKEAINKLAAVCNKRWGICPGAMLTIYNACIEPMLSYALAVWVDRARIDRNRKKFEAVQRYALIRVARSYSSASSRSLCALLKVTPIGIRLDQLALHERLRSGRHRQEFRANSLTAAPPLGRPAPVTPFFERVHPALRALDVRPVSVVENMALDGRVFVGLGVVDGSLCVGVNWRYADISKDFTVLVESGISRPLVCLRLAVLGVEELANAGCRSISLVLPPETYGLLRDRECCLAWVTRLYTLASGFVVFAVSFGKSSSCELTRNCGAPPVEEEWPFEVAFVRDLIADEVVRVWESKWSQISSEKLIKRFFPTISARLSGPGVRLDFIVTQYVTGHGNFNEYVANRRSQWSPYCQFCGAVDDAAHRLLTCQGTADIRDSLPALAEVFVNLRNFEAFRNCVWQIHQRFGD